MTAKEILGITKCGDLFPNDERAAKEEYRKLAKQWHPDVNLDPLAQEVFKQIKDLYQTAVTMIARGEWEKTNYLAIRREDGSRLQINYQTSFMFELGFCYVTKTKVVYILDSSKGKYFENAVKQIKRLSYKDKNMEDKIKNLMPRIWQSFKTSKGEYVLILEKTEDVLPLQSVFDYYKGKIDSKHVAWMISRLCSIACYFDYGGLVHNGININNCFVSPQFHSIMVLGGWWYTTRDGEPLIGTTKDVFSVMPFAAKDKKQSSKVTDLESIKLLGRKLLGEPNCRKIKDAGHPAALIDFLIAGSSNSAFQEFQKWDKALLDAFGKRRFIKMEITSKDVYERKE